MMSYSVIGCVNKYFRENKYFKKIYLSSFFENIIY